MWFVGIAEAGTLGWAQTLTGIFREVQTIGIVCFGLGCVVAGIEIFFRRHLEHLGGIMASLGVGGGLVGVGSGASAVLGAVGGAPLVPVLTSAYNWGDVPGFFLMLGVMLGLPMWSYLTLRRRHAE